jgi:ubiquinone/menaquinone biosynthesis C-methylase UbiE
VRVGSFDRAADYYDATRALPVDVGARVTDVLADELAGTDRCLEVGVGTGRLALPLCERGLRLVGIDVSAAMLARLAANAGGARPLAVCLADATALPFRDGAFGAVIAGHVLHLIPNWTTAVDEIWRVLQLRGRLLVDVGGGGSQAPWHEPVSELLQQHGIVQAHLGVTSVEEIAAHLGTRPRKLSPVPIVVSRTLEQDLADWESQIHSWTWRYPAEHIRTACAAVREWAEDSGRSLDQATEIAHTIEWWAFDHSS